VTRYAAKIADSLTGVSKWVVHLLRTEGAKRGLSGYKSRCAGPLTRG
jgi:hypothetical protein